MRKHTTGNYHDAKGPLPYRMTNDYLFKAMLQESPRVLKELICSVLHLDKNRVHKASILNPIILGDSVDDKDIVLDVRVEFDNELGIDLEMQVANLQNWTERSVYYVCRNLTRLKKGGEYTEAIPSIHVGFLDYTLFSEHPAFTSCFRLMEEKEHYTYTNLIEIHVVDLTNIGLATENDKKYGTDKWAALFKATTWEELKMLAAKNPAIDEAVEVVYEVSEDEKIRQRIEAREDYMRTMADINRKLKEKDELLEQKDELLEQKDELLEQKDDELERSRIRIAQLEAELKAARK